MATSETLMLKSFPQILMGRVPAVTARRRPSNYLDLKTQLFKSPYNRKLQQISIVLFLCFEVCDRMFYRVYEKIYRSIVIQWLNYIKLKFFHPISKKSD